MSRSKHPNPHIESALKYAEDNNWEVTKTSSSSHAWGRMKCPNNDRCCRNGNYCINSIWSTPRTPENHARDIRKIVDKCIFIGDSDE